MEFAKNNRVFFVPFISSKRNFFNFCVLPHCIVFWIHFQNIHTFTYQKTILHRLLLLVFEIIECLQCILETIICQQASLPQKKINFKKKKIDLYFNDLWFDIFNFYFSFKFLHLTVAVKLVPVQPYDRKYFSVKAANASLFSTANRK